MRPSLLTTLLFSLGLPYAQAAGPNADQMVPTIQGVFARCGKPLQLSIPLSKAARDMLGGQELSQAVKNQGFAAYRAQEWTFEFHGHTDWLAQTLAGQCGKITLEDQYGLSTDGETLTLVVAKEAVIDLSQKNRWLSEFLTLTNQARAQARSCGDKRFNATGPLKVDSRLQAAASQYALDMVRLNFTGHVHPVNKSEPWQRAQAAGFVGSVGENLAYGMITPAQAIDGLLKSPKHCENIMNPIWRLFGGAVTNGSTSTLFPTYWVQEFGAQ